MYRSEATDNMEDGEIMDSDHEELTKYVPMVHQQKPSTANHVKQPLAKKLKHSSDSESDAPSDEEGKYSDEENDNISKINKANHSKVSKPKNKFNIWSSVMQDEILTGELTSWSGVNRTMNRDRSVESYDFVRSTLSPRVAKRRRSESNSDDDDDDEKNPRSAITEEANLVDLETFGVMKTKDSSKLSPQQSRKIAKGRRSKPNAETKGKNNKVKANQKEMMPINAKVFELGSTADDVVTELLTVLREPQHMKEVFVLALETVGVERIYKLLRATEDIECSGGLMIVNGQRRRTPGGVFLHLLKSQTTKEEQDQIFVHEKNEKQERKKKKKEMTKQMIGDKAQKLAEIINAQGGCRSSSQLNGSYTMDDELFDESMASQASIELDFC